MEYNKEKAVVAKLEEWQRKVKEVNSWTDKPGTEMDKGAVEITVGLNLLGVGTFGSCEGHPERLSFPYVQLTLPNKPDQAYEGQQQVIEEVAKKYNFSFKEFRSKVNEGMTSELIKLHRKVMDEAIRIYRKNPKTKEQLEYEKDSEAVKDKLRILLDEFYKDRNTDDKIKLDIKKFFSKLESNCVLEYGEMEYKYLEDWGRPTRPIPNELEEQWKKDIRASQNEMKEFAVFLKNKFIETKASS